MGFKKQHQNKMRFSISDEKLTMNKELMNFSKKDEDFLKKLISSIDKNRMSKTIEDFYGQLLKFDYPKSFFSDEMLLKRVKERQLIYFNSFFADKHDVTFFQERIKLGAIHERIGLDNYWYLAAYGIFFEDFVSMITESVGANAAGMDTVKALGKLMLLDIGSVITSYIDAREEVIAAQASEVIELSSPVLKLTDDITVIPLLGTLDSARTFQIMEKILKNIEDSDTKIVILDITGVPVIDTATGANLVRTVNAIRLMGSECIITGIKPNIAQTIVELGIDLSSLKTNNTLASGLSDALKMLSSK